MMRPNNNNKKPYHHIFDMYGDRPPVQIRDVPRPDRPETPSPAPPSSLRFLSIRRSRMHRISRGLLHVHKNGLRTRMPTCPINTTCVGIDDIGEYMYNQAKKCKHLMGETNRMSMREIARMSYVDLPLQTEQSSNNELFTAEQRDEKINVVGENGPPPSATTLLPQTSCWDLPASSELP